MQLLSLTQFSAQTKKPRDVKLKVNPTFELDRWGALCLLPSRITHGSLIYSIIVRAQLEDKQLCRRLGARGAPSPRTAIMKPGGYFKARCCLPPQRTSEAQDFEAIDEPIGLLGDWIGECGSAIDDIKRNGSYRPELAPLCRAVGLVAQRRRPRFLNGPTARGVAYSRLGRKTHLRGHDHVRLE